MKKKNFRCRIFGHKWLAGEGRMKRVCLRCGRTEYSRINWERLFAMNDKILSGGSK